MNKLTKVITSGILASLVVVTTAPVSFVSAETAGSYTLNSSNWKTFGDFDGHPGKYTPGMHPGSITDKIGVSKNKKAIMGAGFGISVDLEIVAGVGQSGNALVQTVLNAPESGAWEPWQFVFDNMKGDAKVDNFEGATDFMFWVDTTKFKDSRGGPKKWDLTIQETDIKNGQLNTKGATAWTTKCQEKSGVLYKEQNGRWVTYPGCKKADKEEEWFPLPENYKGWIRIPITSLCHNSWEQVDSDNKFNGRQIQVVDINQGDWAQQKGSKIVWDSFGFYGNFKTNTPTPSSQISSNAPKTSSNTPVSGTSSTPSAVSGASSSTSSGSSSGSDVSSSSDSSSVAPASEASSKAADTGVKSNNTWLIVLIIVLVAAAAGVGGFFIYKKVKKA